MKAVRSLIFSTGIRKVSAEFGGVVKNTEGAGAVAGTDVDLYVNTDPLDETGLGTRVDSTKSTANGMFYL